MAYALPIVINNRRIFHLYAAPGEQPVRAAHEYFIAALPPGQDCNLLHLDTRKAARLVDEAGKRDIPLSQAQVRMELDVADPVKPVVNIYIRDEAPAPQPKRTHGRDAEDEEDNDDYESHVRAAATHNPVYQPDAPVGTLGSVELRQRYRKHTLALTACRGDGPKGRLGMALTCRVVLTAAGVDYQGEFTLHLTSPYQLLEGALDFGSEASQLRQKRGANAEGQPQPAAWAPLFGLMKDEYAPGATGKFLQQEGTGDELFRSVFFVKKVLDTGNGAYPYSMDGPFLPNEVVNLKSVVAEDELEDVVRDYHQLPNLKLVTKHYNLTDLKLAFQSPLNDRLGKMERLDARRVLQQAYATVMRQMVRAWLIASLRRLPNELKQYVRLVLLVPNVYTETDLQSTKQTINNIFDSFKRDREVNALLAGYEIMTVSESDAAFIGHYLSGRFPRNRDKKPGYYVIIDCGKGTTDYSVLKYEDPNDRSTIQPIYRNGLAGAGNLISYGVFRAVANYILEVDRDSKERSNSMAFLKKLVSVNDFYKNRLWKIIEELKVKFDAAKAEEAATAWGALQKSGKTGFADLKETSLVSDVIDELLQATVGKGLPDVEGHFTTETCRIIRSVLSEGLDWVVSALREQGMECSGVFFTGRGLQFERLRTELSIMLTQMLGIKLEKIHAPSKSDEYKTIAAEHVLNSPFILDPDCIGIPIQISFSENDKRKKAAQATPKLTTQFLKLLTDSIRYGIRGKAAVSIAPFEKLKPPFDTNELLIGNIRYIPEDLPALPNDGYTYNAVYNPSPNAIGMESRIYIRQRQAGTALITGVSPLRHTDELIDNLDSVVVGSLFPVIIPEDFIDSIR